MPDKITQFANLIRSTKREKKLGMVIFFITSRCNAACETCFYHEELNKRGDLTFEQIEKISDGKTYDKIRGVLKNYPTREIWQ